MKRVESDADISEGLAHLAACEPRLAPVIAAAGDIPLRRYQPGVEGLCKIIVSQQLSVASANAIWNKITNGLGSMDAAAILSAHDATFKACGLSAPKIRTLRAIAAAILEGALPIDRLHHLPAETAIPLLTAVRGIGPWTAEIYLMFYAGHRDVFAPGDLALQEAVRIAFSLEKRPNAKELAALAEAWSPWRAVAARLLWAYYRVAKTREGIT